MVDREGNSPVRACYCRFAGVPRQATTRFDTDSPEGYPLAAWRGAARFPAASILAGQGSLRPAVSTEETILVQPRSVLIVDQSEDTREVLTTALARRGLKTFSASRPRRGLQLARQHRPDLIVLDLEIAGSEGEEVSAPFAEESAANHSALVMLGSVRRRQPSPPVGEFVPKPYHYGSLIRRIEELLMGTGRARCA